MITLSIILDAIASVYNSVTAADINKVKKALQNKYSGKVTNINKAIQDITYALQDLGYGIQTVSPSVRHILTKEQDRLRKELNDKNKRLESVSTDLQNEMDYLNERSSRYGLGGLVKNALEDAGGSMSVDSMVKKVQSNKSIFDDNL